MRNGKPGWTHVLRRYGPNYLGWLASENVLLAKFDALATALSTLFRRDIRTPEAAADVRSAVPAVLGRCNEQSTYAMPGAPYAYAWLHLLDRYARTWAGLERLVHAGCLPLAKHGVRTLDVGTGPGPSAFAVHDFYAAITKFAGDRGIEVLRQPPQIECVESDSGTNIFRHRLAEEVCGQLDQRAQSSSVLTLCQARSDFRQILPRKERRRLYHQLREEEIEYFDVRQDEWTSDRVRTPAEANEIAQTLYRYRLIIFSNFLTTVGDVVRFEGNLRDVLYDARPGTVLLVLGGKRGPYT